MDPIHYFLHIPKTAGTSLNTYIERATNFQTCPDWLWSQLLRRPQEELDRYNFFRGHFYRHLDSFLGRPLITFTILRNPVDRAISHYQHIRRDPKHYFHEYANQQGTFLKFLTDPVTQPLIRNFQTRCLSQIFEVRELARSMSAEEFNPLAIERHLETFSTPQTSAESLSLAQGFLEQCAFVGITERMHDSVALLATVIGRPLASDDQRYNANPDSTCADALDAKEINVLTELLENDLQLYCYAANLFDQRCRQAAGRLPEPLPTFVTTGQSEPPFVSHAQNAEDVLLYRALGHIPAGTYVDIGANDPDTDSVTKAFYDRGWRGLNVEPVRKWYDLLCTRRPRDTNLCLAAGKVSGTVHLFEVADSGLSTIDPEVAAQYCQAGTSLVERVVPVERLERLFEQYDLRTIHFLKIDVEGAEKDVIQGLDLTSFRPWVIVVEATAPNSRVSTHDHWEYLLTSRSYLFAYFDGLNRFYVATEHDELLAKLSVQANIHDRFVTARHADIEKVAIDLDRRLQDAEMLLRETELKVVDANNRVLEIEKLANDVIASAQQEETRRLTSESSLQDAPAESQPDATPALRLADLTNSYRLLSEEDFAALVAQECSRR